MWNISQPMGCSLPRGCNLDLSLLGVHETNKLYSFCKKSYILIKIWGVVTIYLTDTALRNWLFLLNWRIQYLMQANIFSNLCQMFPCEKNMNTAIVFLCNFFLPFYLPTNFWPKFFTWSWFGCLLEKVSVSY